MLASHPPLCLLPPNVAAIVLVLQIKKRARGAEFDFNSPEWAAISDGAKDLLRKLIVRNPAVCVLSCHSLGHGPGSASLCTVPVLLRSLCYT